MSRRQMERARLRSAERRRRRALRAAAAGVAAAGAAGALAPAAQAGNFTVTSLADGPPNACNADCTLRDALEAGLADGTPDVITFAANLSGTIELGPAQDSLEIYAAVDLRGPGANRVSVDGNGSVNPFYVSTGQPVTISGLTVKDGRNAYGGGLYAFEANDLTLDRMTFTGNRVTDSGGAVGTKGGNLTIRNSAFIGNSSDDDAGAVGGSMQELEISDSRFTGNSAVGDGGAIRVSGSTDIFSANNATFDHNTAGNDGGALLLFGPEISGGVSNTTITGNTAARSGGGIHDKHARDAGVNFDNSTITGNTAGYRGGGVYRYAYDDPGEPGPDETSMLSTIVAGNTAPTGPDISQRSTGMLPVSGTFRIGFSLIGDPSSAPVVTVQPNVVGEAPKLGPLRNNGGPTPTMAPQPGSPVIDAGAGLMLAGDQRGLPRTVDQPRLVNVSDGSDIGAVEVGRVDGAKVAAKRKQRQRGRRIKVKVKAGAAEAVTAEAAGTVAVGKRKFALKPATSEVDAGETATLALKPASKRAAKKVRRALDRGKKVKATLTVTLTDATGAVQTTTSRVTLE